MKRRRWLFLILILGIFLTVMKYHPRYFVRTVEIEGQNFTLDASLRDWVTIYDTQNIIWTMYVSGMGNKMMSQFPTIKALSITANLPSKLTIKITEKTPWIILTINGRGLVFAEDGSVLNLLNEGSVIEDWAATSIVNGVSADWINHSYLNTELLLIIKRLIDGLSAYDLRDHTSIHFVNLRRVNDFVLFDEIVLRKNDQLNIFMGDASNFEEKLSHLKSFFEYYADLDSSTNLDTALLNVEYVDIRAFPKIIVK